MASSSSASPSVPTFSSQGWKYHVFLSFRGEDTRKTFVDHLYTALEQQGIYTYKDDETLPRGESIGPSLVTAIEESQIAVIIFSKNYADSSWCLDELVHIMKCKDMRGQIVIPIFYDVDPSDVRKQKRKYEEAFAKHKLENNNKVDSWRKALADASNISGWEPRHESKGIKIIVDAISPRLCPITSSLDDNLVGLEARMKGLILKLQIGSGGKKMIGIWGVGGSGKTTLASSIYDKISSKYDGCCFIKNIREESSNMNGLERLQEKIIYGVLKQKQVEVGRVEEGRSMIKDRLQHRRVLIVLDDVDKLEHLEQLVGSRDWFGEGSRILITTRDEHVLIGHKVDVIHKMSLLDNDEAMKLFCKLAPRGHRSIEDYKQLSKDVASYASGLPLALRVLSRFLCDKEMNEWRSALDRLKEIPDANMANILKVLKISFDGLEPEEKELFLDIACFFRGSYKDGEVMMILDACGFHPVIGIKVLVQKALITISSDGRFDMHDLVQELAHNIVRGEHPKNPEKHSRVWKEEDFLKICAMGATTNLDKIEAINIRWFKSDESQRVLLVVANMKKLRWIRLNYVWTSSPESFKLKEDGLLQTTLPLMPEDFPPMELCGLSLFSLKLKQLWEGYKYLPNLKMIELQNLNNLIKTPDFEGLPNLERFLVFGCSLLEEIHPSIRRLEKLLSVAIKNCGNLKIVPPITRSMKLETFVLSGCYFSKIEQNMENILPQNMNHIGLWFISRCLRKLNLSMCDLEDEDIRSDAVWELPYLEEFNLKGNYFGRLNFSLLALPRLKYLNISNCYLLVELLGLPLSIAVVIADGCISLKTFGDISNCKWLWKLSLCRVGGLGQLAGDELLQPMLQGNPKDHFININISHTDVWRGFIPWLNWVKKFTMQLPHDWYDKYSGILMFVKSDKEDVYMNIIMKQGVEEDFQSELGQEPNKTEISFDGMVCVGYVSFSSLPNTACLNSTYNMLSFSIHCNHEEYKHMFGAVLVPRKSRDNPMQTTDCSEFWDDGKTFRVQHHSESSIKILWTPRKRFLSNYFRAFSQLLARS